MQKLPKYIFTKEKLNSIKQELDLAIKNRPELVTELAEARSLGDLSENGRYKAARKNLSNIDSKIRRLRNWIQFSSVIDNSINKKGVIGLGSKVLVKVRGKEMQLQIVGVLEADPKIKKISNKSPIGKALIGHKSGDKVNIKVPVGEIEYLILKVYN